MAETNGLLNRPRVSNLSAGSNPAPSATPLKVKGFSRFTLWHFWHSEAIVSHLCAPLKGADLGTPALPLAPS